jgi:hypothetical protein
MGKGNHHKEKRIKIVDPKKIDYTYIGYETIFNIESLLYNSKINDGSNKSKIDKNDQRLRYDTKNSKTRTKGRITGGQSMQGHSSVYK